MKLVTIEIRGKSSTWAINWYATQEEIDAMRSDGLEIYEIVYSVPVWVVDIGLLRVYCFFQDLWNFRNPL